MAVWVHRWSVKGSLAAVLILASLVGLSGCGLFSGEQEDKTAGWSAEKLYSEAQDEMAQGGYDQAVKYLRSLQTRYPFGRYAQQGLMEECYAQWKAQEPEQALAACDKFIKEYPNNPNIDYVYYVRGLVNFSGDLGFLGGLAKQDLTERDPKSLREGFDSFREVVTRFPDSRYTPDSYARMRYLVNALASHEIFVASYYLRRGAYVAAADRAKGVLLNYQQTPSTEDAMEIMVDAYDKLGLPGLRDDTKKVLAENFPNHVPGKFTPKEKVWWKLW
ncbi:MAG: outer membrane protein assembly factor BamD [Burkholderiaceae bacterium]|jgi:outer membrane protein assembly factor BamD